MPTRTLSGQGCTVFPPAARGWSEYSPRHQRHQARLNVVLGATVCSSESSMTLRILMKQLRYTSVHRVPESTRKDHLRKDTKAPATNHENGHFPAWRAINPYVFDSCASHPLHRHSPCPLNGGDGEGGGEGVCGAKEHAHNRCSDPVMEERSRTSLTHCDSAI